MKMQRIENLIIGDTEDIRQTYKSMCRHGVKRDILYPLSYDFPDFEDNKNYGICIDDDYFYLVSIDIRMEQQPA